jgi:hypothetical protein|tara:strand:- start:6972 stop:7220 length:249 start_codon:yes stop_codon:yes gene_type:complete
MMDEHWTCIECEFPFDESDGDLDERMCNECLDNMCGDSNKERRDPNIQRSSTVHYPDWDKQNKKYIVRKRIVGKLDKGETTC